MSQGYRSGSFKKKDNRSPEEKELTKLCKESSVSQHGERYFKVDGADHEAKLNIIRNNRYKYSASINKMV